MTAASRTSCVTGPTATRPAASARPRGSARLPISGYQLSRRQLTAVVAAGFERWFSTGGNGPDGLVLQASDASRLKLRHLPHGYNAARGLTGSSTCAAITRTAHRSPHRGP